jgi:hypothetical protein
MDGTWEGALVLAIIAVAARIAVWLTEPRR